MKKGFIYRLIYGKDKDKDFTVSDLPKNRVKQFFYVFRNRFGVIFRVNLLAGLFFVPLLVWDFLLNGYVSNFMKGLSVQEQFSYLLKISLLQQGTEVPMIMLAFVGLAGAYRVIRCLCWGAPVKLIKEFNRGIKEGYKQFLLLGLITGIYNFGLNYLINFNLLTVSQSVEFWHVLAIAGLAVLTLICFAALVLAVCQASLYSLSFFTLLKNSFILAFRRMFRAIGITLLSVLPVLIFRLLPWAFMQIIGGCVTLVIGIGFAVTMQTVFCLGVFDEYINKKSYPKFVNLGLNTGLSYYQAVSDGEEQAEATDEDNG